MRISMKQNKLPKYCAACLATVPYADGNRRAQRSEANKEEEMPA
jgi:hypothetical protein